MRSSSPRLKSMLASEPPVAGEGAQAQKLERPERDRIGPYELMTTIGEGGMGTVYLAKMDGLVGLNKLAVVKELRPDLASSEQFVAMFLNEARLAARLTHSNIVHTYGAAEDDGRLYIAMEYLDGQPWVLVRRRLWRSRSLPLSIHLKVLVDTLAGVHYAHEACDYDGTPLQVVHCDVSPHNVFVTYEGQVKIVDFGVARAVTGSEVKGRPAFAGKLSYAAPEQLSSQPIDRRADIFAVGVMLWEALVGRPFAAGQERGDIVRKRLRGEEPRVRDVVPTVSRALADVCDRATARSPDDRFATAAEFRKALIDYIGQHASGADDTQLAGLVSEAFREERQAVREVIERHLTPPNAPIHVKDTPLRPPATQIAERAAREGVGLSDPGLLHLPEVEHTMAADLSEFASVSKLSDDAAVAEASIAATVRPTVATRRKRLALIGGGVAAGLLVLALALWPRADPVERATTGSQGPDEHTSEGADPEQPGVIQLEIAVLPGNATVLLDGEPLGQNPYSGRVPRDNREHVIAASAPGLQAKEWVVTFEHNLNLSYWLQADGPEPAETESATERPAARSKRRPSRGRVRNGARSSRVQRRPAPPQVEADSKAATAAAQPEGPSAPDHEGERRPTRSPAGPDFGSALEVDREPRDIYDEDPY